MLPLTKLLVTKLLLAVRSDHRPPPALPPHPHEEEKVKAGFGENFFARIHAFQKSKGIENSETQLHGYFTVLSNNLVSRIFRFLDHALSHLHNK